MWSEMEKKYEKKQENTQITAKDKIETNVLWQRPHCLVRLTFLLGRWPALTLWGGAFSLGIVFGLSRTIHARTLFDAMPSKYPAPQYQCPQDQASSFFFLPTWGVYPDTSGFPACLPTHYLPPPGSVF